MPCAEETRTPQHGGVRPAPEHTAPSSPDGLDTWWLLVLATTQRPRTSGDLWGQAGAKPEGQAGCPAGSRSCSGGEYGGLEQCSLPGLSCLPTLISGREGPMEQPGLVKV